MQSTLVDGIFIMNLCTFSVVIGAVHDKIFPVVCHLSQKEDREFQVTANYMHSQKIFSADRLGLPEDFCVPLPAAVIELAALDMRTTPLDRLTCIYDTVEQVKVHLKQALLESRGDEIGEDSGDVMLPIPVEREMIMLLASVVVQARPCHMLSTLNYADMFAWTVPTDMMYVSLEPYLNF